MAFPAGQKEVSIAMQKLEAEIPEEKKRECERKRAVSMHMLLRMH